MIGALVFNVIAVFFAWLESSWNFKHGLKFSLFVIFLFLALRYDYGNDYMGYLAEMLRLKNGSNSIYYKGNEIGWFILNNIFKPFGFFALQIFLAAFSSIVIFRFVKKYVPQQYYWLAIFLYVFTPGIMLTLSSAMRQQVAVVIFLLAIDFLINRKYFYYLLLVFIATLFHSSAFFLFILVFIGFVNFKVDLLFSFLFLILFIVPFYLKDEIYFKLTWLTESYFDFYSSYTKEANFDIGVGLGFALSIFEYIIIYYVGFNYVNVSNSVFFRLALVSMLLLPIGFTGIPLIGRLNFYLLPVFMVVYPQVIAKIQTVYFRFGFICIISLFVLYQFFIFFESPIWEKSFGTYHTIFSASEFY